MSFPDSDKPQSHDPDFEFDVALSFAEEDWRFVHGVAGRLRRKNIKAYYYKEANDDADLWGTDLFHHLQNIYQYKSRFCVMFISKHYKEKFWTLQEQEWVRARDLINAKGEYILPFRFDNTEIEGISKTIHFLSAERYNEKRLAGVITRKVLRYRGNVGDLRPKPGSLIRKPDLAVLARHKIKLLVTGISALLGLTGYLCRDYLTPVDVLSRILHERSAVVVEGSMCKDGWFSKSRGSGTCSGHGGVAELKDSVQYLKTLEECEEEARAMSMIP